MLKTMKAALISRPLPGHVMLIGINYWPEQTGNAPYTTGLAEHLVAQGCRVTVITGMPYYPQWRVFDEYQGRLRLRERIRGVDVQRFRQYVPSRQSALQRALFEGTFLAHALPFLGSARPDLVVGIVPSLSGGLLAAAAARRYRVPFGLLFQDLVGQGAVQSGIPGGGKVARFTRTVEGALARRAAAIAIVAEGFRPYLENLGVDPACIRRVRNWTHIRPPAWPRMETRARLGFPPEAWVCLHAGNMGFKQGLENLLDCARLAQTVAPELLFILVGDGNQRAYLQHAAAALPNVRFLPPQSEEDFPEVLAAADVLLVNQRPSVTDMALPGKLTSYFIARRPVVAAVAPKSETAVELITANAGLVVEAGMPERLLNALRYLAATPHLADEMGENGRRYALEHLTADAALAQLERFICDLAAVHRSNAVAPASLPAKQRGQS